MSVLKVLSILSLLIFCKTVYGQQIITINGRVTDALDDSELIFANISFANNRYGTITNEKGEFIIKIPDVYQNDTISVSFVGYERKSIPLCSVQNEFITVKLNPIEVNIKQVNVYPKNPKKIISEAINKVKDNFINIPMRMNALYREIILENENKIQHIEAVLDIYKGAYGNNKDQDRMQIIKGREFASLKTSALWEHLFFINGPYEIIQQDIAKYPFDFINVVQTNINFLKAKHYKFYSYSLTEIESKKDNHSLYIIHFKPAKKRALFEGKITIDKKSLAILSILLCCKTL